MYTRTDKPAARRPGSHRQRRRRGARRPRQARSTSRCTPTARSASTTTAAASRSACIPKRRSASSRSSSRACTPAASSTRAATRAYSFSGGLHGVGVSVTNALAKRLEVTVWRDGQVATIAFAGGDVVEPLASASAGAGERKSGTRVRVWPDPKYFESAELPRAELTHLLRSKAVLMPGVKVSLTVEKPGRGEPERHDWLYAGGLRDYLMQTLAGRSGDPAVRRRAPRRRPRERGLRRRRRRGLVRRLHRRRRRGARELRQPDPDGRRRHPRVGPEGRPVRRGEGLHRHARAAAQGRQADARRRVLARQLRALGEGARPAVPGPDQGAAEQPRRAAPGLDLRAAGARALAEPARRARQEARRARHPPGADAPAREPEGREEEGLGRRGAAGQAHRLREPRPGAATSSSWSRAIRPAAAPRWAATRRRRRSCRCAARCSTPGRSSATACSPTTRSTTSRSPIGVDPHGADDTPDLSGLRYGKVCILSRRRRRRLAHPGAAADAVLPPLPEADRARPRLRRQAAAVSRRRAGARQEAGGEDLRARRGRAARDRSTSCARKARAKAPGASAASRAWAR